MVTLDCTAKSMISDSQPKDSGVMDTKPGDTRIRVRCPGILAILRTNSLIVARVT